MTPEEQIVIGDTPEEFADQTVRLLRNKACSRTISRAGHGLVTQNHDWMNVALKLRDHCKELAEQI